MSLLIVGVADCRVSSVKDHVLVTYALGSCIGMTVYDPVTYVGGLLHFMLPDSTIDPAKGATNPFKFADTGIPKLLDMVTKEGANRRRLVVRIAGGAQMMDTAGVFDIGRRNHQALRKILWKAGILVHAEDVGGTMSRSVRLEVGTGRLTLRFGDGGEKEMPLNTKAAKGETQCRIAS